MVPDRQTLTRVPLGGDHLVAADSDAAESLPALYDKLSKFLRIVGTREIPEIRYSTLSAESRTSSQIRDNRIWESAFSQQNHQRWRLLTPHESQRGGRPVREQSPDRAMLTTAFNQERTSQNPVGLRRYRAEVQLPSSSSGAF